MNFIFFFKLQDLGMNGGLFKLGFVFVRIWDNNNLGNCCLYVWKLFVYVGKSFSVMLAASGKLLSLCLEVVCLCLEAI